MKIAFSDKFIAGLDDILTFIALDSIDRAMKFNDELYKKITKLCDMPYKFRKSLSFDDESIRDLIYKGYVVPYFIDEKAETIVILGIFKENIVF